MNPISTTPQIARRRLPSAERARRAAAALALLGLVVTLPGCTWARRFGYEGFGRDGWQKPEQVLDALALPAGARVADLGSGGGYFTWRLADAVGDDGRVFAVDVDDELLAYIADESGERGYRNVSTVRAAYEDPKIPEPVELIFTSNTYHHLEDRPAYFAGAKRYLRPGGRIAIIDLQDRGGIVGWFMRGHTTEPDLIEREMEQAGYVLDARHDFLDRQSFLVFRLPAS